MGNTEVIIIGAGIAGVKASLELTKAGISNVILESRDRLGGRLLTEKLVSGVPIDLGASWFHDCFDNPLLKKYWQSGKVDFNYDDGRLSIYNEDGLLDDNTRLKPVAEEIKLYLKNLYDSLGVDEDISVKQAIYDYIQEKKWCLTEYQIRHVPQLVRYFEMWIGSSWEILSARNISADEHKGRDAMVMNGYATVYNSELDELVQSSLADDGLQTLLTKDMYSNVPGGCSIKINHIVYKIHWDDNNKKITVSTKTNDHDGNEHLETFTSDYLIFTAPLSILKLKDLNETGAIEWIPPLPKNFRSSLDKISFSNLGKVFFEFPETFWSLEDDRILSLANVDEEYFKATKNGTTINLTSPTNKLDKQLLLTGPIPNGLDYSILFMNLAKPTGKPLILALTSSPLTQYIEQQSAEVIFQVFKPVFVRISRVKGFDVPIPKEIKTSKWSNDPFARGSYTGVTVGDDYETALQQLINPADIFDGTGRVRFAGEGTTDDGNGCAHAAWVTGQREADQIKKMINRPKL